YLPWLAILIVFWIFISRQMQGPGNRAMSFGKTRAKMFNEEDTKETFNDVEGCREAKEDLQEIIAFLKEPKKFTDLGARIPKGVLLMGPPGTGKTLLAKAVAGEAKVPFFHMSGSEFVEMFVGVGASRVRDLFEQGRKNAPCIIFIDELDAVGRSRGAGYGGGHDEREQTLNQMLVEMDGFDTTEAVIIMAATNRPDVLDPALLRPGRFDRQVIIDLPDVAGREGILKIHARKVKLDVAAELSNIARGTPGFSGADLANLINEAALLTGRRNKLIISMSELEEAKDKVMMGPERRSMIISESEKKNTAFHEAGHALVSLLTPQADFLHKVSIIPRGRALGLTQSLPDDGSHTMSKNKLEARLRVLMAGRVAEEIFIGDYSNGAANDIERATRIARAMVCEWGMSSLGPVAYGQKEEPIFIGKEIARHKDYSEEKARSIDDEVDKIILSAYADVKKLLTREKNRLKRLAEALLEKEVMNSHEIGTLLGIKIKEQEDLRKTASPFKSTVPAEESPAAPVTEKI
ncbi:MAG: cell division protein FtsH, partial [Spirochaetes bacterium GWF1_41_5]